MITTAWRRDLEEAEEVAVVDLLSRARARDEEPGFPLLELRPLTSADRHLLVWLAQPEESGETAAPRLAAYLRLQLTDGNNGLVEYVVDPDLRSRGVTTMLLEQLGLDVSGEHGWSGTGAARLQVWALGDHPAAERAARRFRHVGVRRGRQEWHLLGPLRPQTGSAPVAPPRPTVDDQERRQTEQLWPLTRREAQPTSADVLVVADDGAVRGAVWFDAENLEQTEHGPAARIHGVVVATGEQERRTRADLLAAAMEDLRCRGLRVAVLTLDPADEALVRDARTVGFAHDRTDTEYVLA